MVPHWPEDAGRFMNSNNIPLCPIAGHAHADGYRIEPVIVGAANSAPVP